MSAVNANLISRTFPAKSAVNNQEPHKGKVFPAKRAKGARDFAQKSRTSPSEGFLQASQVAP